MGSVVVVKAQSCAVKTTFASDRGHMMTQQGGEAGTTPADHFLLVSRMVTSSSQSAQCAAARASATTAAKLLATCLGLLEMIVRRNHLMPCSAARTSSEWL